MALDPALVQQIQAILGTPQTSGYGAANPNGQGGMFEQLSQLLSQYGGTPAPKYQAFDNGPLNVQFPIQGNIDPGFNRYPNPSSIDPGFNMSQDNIHWVGSIGNVDPGFNRQPSLGPNIAPAYPLPKPIVGQPVPGIPNRAPQSQPARPQVAQATTDPRNHWLQGNGQPRIPVVHDRTGASADTLSRGQRMRFDNIRNLYGGERAAAARANMLEHNARRPIIPAAPTPAAPPPGAMQVPTMTVPVANIAPEDPAVIAAARRARAIMARPEIPRARRR